MFAEIRTYIIALFCNWAALIWGTSLIFDVGALVLRNDQQLAVNAFLDRVVPEKTRVALLRTLLVVGLMIAGFNAWDEQYQIAIKLSTTQDESRAAEPKSAYSSLSNAALRDVTIEHVKAVRALDERTQEDLQSSESNFTNEPFHARHIHELSESEMLQYNSYYLAKSIALMQELRKREPDHVQLMDAEHLSLLDRAYSNPVNPFDVMDVINDLDVMAQKLPPDTPR